MKKNFYGFWTIAVIFFCAAGCVEVKDSVDRSKSEMRETKHKYKEIDASALTLKLISRPVVTASTRCTLTFAITNTGGKRIQIREWMREESDNLVIYAQPWLTQMTGPDPDRWIKLEVEPKKKAYHYPMILMPGNQALVTKELPFIEKMRIAPGEERRFFIRAESNLSSLKLSTEVIGLRVIPKILPKK